MAALFGARAWFFFILRSRCLVCSLQPHVEVHTAVSAPPLRTPRVVCFLFAVVRVPTECLMSGARRTPQASGSTGVRGGSGDMVVRHMWGWFSRSRCLGVIVGCGAVFPRCCFPAFFVLAFSFDLEDEERAVHGWRWFRAAVLDVRVWFLSSRGGGLFVLSSQATLLKNSSCPKRVSLVWRAES